MLVTLNTTVFRGICLVWLCSVCCVCMCVLSHVQLFATPWTVSHQAPQSLGFFRQECWSGLPFLIPGILPDLGIEPMSPVSPTLAGRFFTYYATWETQHFSNLVFLGNDLITAFLLHTNFEFLNEKGDASPSFSCYV